MNDSVLYDFGLINCYIIYEKNVVPLEYDPSVYEQYKILASSVEI